MQTPASGPIPCPLIPKHTGDFPASEPWSPWCPALPGRVPCHPFRQLNPPIHPSGSHAHPLVQSHLSAGLWSHRGPGAWLSQPRFPQGPWLGAHSRERWSRAQRSCGLGGLLWVGSKTKATDGAPQAALRVPSAPLATPPPSLSLASFPFLSGSPAISFEGKYIYLLTKGGGESRVLRNQEAVSDPGTQSPFPTCRNWGGGQRLSSGSHRTSIS